MDDSLTKTQKDAYILLSLYDCESSYGWKFYSLEMQIYDWESQRWYMWVWFRL